MTWQAAAKDALAHHTAPTNPHYAILFFFILPINKYSGRSKNILLRLKSMFPTEVCFRPFLKYVLRPSYFNMKTVIATAVVTVATAIGYGHGHVRDRSWGHGRCRCQGRCHGRGRCEGRGRGHGRGRDHRRIHCPDMSWLRLRSRSSMQWTPLSGGRGQGVAEVAVMVIAMIAASVTTTFVATTVAHMVAATVALRIHQGKSEIVTISVPN